MCNKPLLLILLTTLLLTTTAFGQTQLIIQDTNYTDKQITQIEILGQRIPILDQYKNILLIQVNETQKKAIKTNSQYKILGEKELQQAYMQMTILLAVLLVMITVFIQGHRKHKDLHKKITYHKERYHGTKKDETKTQTKRTRQKKILHHKKYRKKS